MSSTEQPTVSVVIPAYNAAAYLAEAVNSALNQSFNDIEVIVVDDGSTDDTPDVIASFGDRIRPVRRENGGVAEALNTGISTARGRYVALLASDDRLCVDSIAIRVRLLEANLDAGFVHGAAYEINASGSVLGARVRAGKRVVTQTSREAVVQLLQRNTVVCSSVMVRKSALDEAGGFRQEFMPGEDWHMWLRLAARHAVIYTREIVASYRIHDESLTARFELDSYEAAHLRTLRSLFDEGGIGEHADLRGYAFASHLRTIASMAAYVRRPFVSFRYVGRAIRRRPQFVAEFQTWLTLYHAAKALLPPRAVRFGSSVKGRLRRQPADLSESKKPAS